MPLAQPVEAIGALPQRGGRDRRSCCEPCSYRSGCDCSAATGRGRAGRAVGDAGRNCAACNEAFTYVSCCAEPENPSSDWRGGSTGCIGNDGHAGSGAARAHTSDAAATSRDDSRAVPSRSGTIMCGCATRRRQDLCLLGRKRTAIVADLLRGAGAGERVASSQARHVGRQPSFKAALEIVNAQWPFAANGKKSPAGGAKRGERHAGRFGSLEQRPRV